MSALRDPRFRRLLAGSSLSSFGDSCLYLTLGIWAKSLTGSNAAAGGVFLALGIPALFAPLTGQLADRVPRRRLLIVTSAATGLMVLSLLAVHSRAQLWIIYLVAFLYGLSFGIMGSASAGLRKDLLPDDDLGGANAALQTTSQGLRIVSPLAGAALFAVAGGGSVAVLDAAAVADGIGLIWLVVAFSTAAQRHTPPHLQGRVNAAWMMLVLTPQTISIAVGAALISFVDYRTLLLVIVAVLGACALLLLLRPVPEPAIPAVSAPPAANGSTAMDEAA